MPNYVSITAEEFQSIFDQVIAYLNNKNLSEPDWKEISYIFVSEKYVEIADGQICYVLNLENLALNEFNDDFFEEYLEEGEKINNSKRIKFSRERISSSYEDYTDYTFSIHAVEIQNKENQKAFLGFTVSGPGGQHGYTINCIGVFSNTKELLKTYDSSYLLYDKHISDSHILRLWKRSQLTP
jgi:hypothetical protein